MRQPGPGHGRKYPSLILKVLITGANGLIGNLVFANLAGRQDTFEPYGSARREQSSSRIVANFYHIPVERMRTADLAEFDEVRTAVEGMDAVVHMAANADSYAPWAGVLRDNIIATHNVFEASRQAGVKRVIFASTNQVVFGYRDTEPYKALFEGRFAEVDLASYKPIVHTVPTRPTNYYAASKVHGEALTHLYAMAHGMSGIVLRIGWVTGDDVLPQTKTFSGRHLWCSHRDIVQLVTRCLLAPATLRFDVFFGQSQNKYNLVDIQHPMDVVGYAPQDGAP